jgi:hypothetical protein
MRDTEKRAVFLSNFGFQEDAVVWQEQVHSDMIQSVTSHDSHTVIPEVDGIVYKKQKGDPQVVLSVHTADCTPLLFLDPEEHIIGAAHAGWKGTLLHIGRKMISRMIQLGSRTSHIYVCVGPHICGDCYDVDDIRRNAFEKEFPNSDVVSDKNNKAYVDIGRASALDVEKEGVQKNHIDIAPSFCTYENEHLFYSYRKTGKPLNGEIIGVIGL